MGIDRTAGPRRPMLVAVAAAAALAPALAALCQPAVAPAQPLPPPPYVPGEIEALPGGYGFSYDVIIVGPPAARSVCPAMRSATARHRPMP